MKTTFIKLLSATALALGAIAPMSRADDQPAAEEAPHILWDKSPRIVAYQLNRLSSAQLSHLELKPEAQYKPGYEAQLTHKGIDMKLRQSAIDALAQIEKSSPVVELLEAIGKVDKEDRSTPRELIGMLLAQKPADLAAQHDKIESLAGSSDSDLVKEAAFAALAVADAKPDQAWQLASSKDNLKQMISGIPLIKDAALRGAFYPLVNPLVTSAKDPATQVAAVEAISAVPGHDAESFKELAGIITSGGKGDVRDAAIRSIRRINSDNWPTDGVELLANTIVTIVKNTPADQRTGTATAQAVQLGNDLSSELDDAKGAAIRKQLRELAVPVVVIRTLREQMQYDLKYFVVQAGKPVEIILENGDAMPHNLVVTDPGKMQEVAVQAGSMPPPTDDTKAYIPDNKAILGALSMVQPDESRTLTITAPAKPGEYDFVCTFPGHWVRMYGVMLVVPDLEAYEKNPTPPHDPMTHKAYDTQKNEANAAMAGMSH